MKEKNDEISALLTEAAGYTAVFHAAIEGTVAESDKAILAQQKAAKEQAQSNLDRVFDTFGRENVRVIDE
ncbi:MAG: hypothetical protein Q4G52_03180 [Clostridia bacterium]|nr:hypothetical protein [Clostridia bacterium]